MGKNGMILRPRPLRERAEATLTFGNLSRARGERCVILSLLYHPRAIRESSVSISNGIRLNLHALSP
jgi:hypothetical protein